MNKRIQISFSLEQYLFLLKWASIFNMSIPDFVRFLVSACMVEDKKYGNEA